MVLAGVVTCGFAGFYKAAWWEGGVAGLGGMAGHGLRYLGLAAGPWVGAGSLLGGLGVGGVSGWRARSGKVPFAVIAFAGAVTMMPGLHMYRALGGAIRLARLTEEQDAVMAAMLSNAAVACLVVSGLALGLVLGGRAVLALAGERDQPSR